MDKESQIILPGDMERHRIRVRHHDFSEDTFAQSLGEYDSVIDVTDSELEWWKRQSGGYIGYVERIKAPSGPPVITA